MPKSTDPLLATHADQKLIDEIDQLVKTSQQTDKPIKSRAALVRQAVEEFLIQWRSYVQVVSNSHQLSNE